MPQTQRRIVVVEEPEAAGPSTSSVSGLDRPKTSLPTWLTAGIDASVNAMQPKDMARGAAAGLLGGASVVFPPAAGVIPSVLAATGAGAAGGALEAGANGEPVGAGALSGGAAGGATAGLGALLTKVPGLALRIWQGAAGTRNAQAAEDVLLKGLGRLTQANTGKLEQGVGKIDVPLDKFVKSADSSQWAAKPSGLVHPSSGQPLPSVLTREVSDPRGLAAVDAHAAGVAKSSRALSAPRSTLGAAVAMASHPGVRAALSQGAYSLSPNNPTLMLNAIRAALESLGGGSEK